MSMGGDIRQQVTLEMRGVGGDTVTILEQALRELQAQFNKNVASFDTGKSSALDLIASLKSLAGDLAEVSKLANADAAAMAKTEAAMVKAAEAADRLAERQTRAADREADADARREAANAKKLADAEGWAAMQAKLGEMEQRSAAETREAIATANAARQHGTEAIAGLVAKTREQVQAEKEAAAETDKMRRAFEATVVPINAMIDAAMRFKSVQIDASLKADAQAWDKFQLVTRDATQNIGGFATEAERSADKSKRLGYALLNVSYAAQDAQYGMGAIANNIGLVTMSIGNAIPKFASATAIIGGPAGLGAILMGLGVAAEILWKNWDKVTAVFGGDEKFFRLATDATTLKEKLKELTEKTWKTNWDYAEIETLTKKVDVLTAKHKAYLELSTGKTEEQRDREKMVTEIITEKGGGTDFDSGAQNIAKILTPLMKKRVSPTATGLREQIAALRESMKTDNSIMKLAHGSQVMNLEADLQDFETREKQGQIADAEHLVGGAKVDANDNIRLMQMIRDNKGAFKKGGLDPDSLVQALWEATPRGMAKSAKIDLDLAATEGAHEASVEAVKGRFKKIREGEKDDQKAQDLFDRMEREGEDRRAKWEIGGRDERDVGKGEQDENKAIRQQFEDAKNAIKANDPNKQLAAEKAHLKTLALFGDTVQIQAEAAMRLNMMEQQQKAILGVQRRVRGGRRPKQVKR